MTAHRGTWQGPAAVLARAIAAALLVLLFTHPAAAEEKAQLLVTNEGTFGRLVLNFPNRLDLPTYRLRYDNGVLAVEFEQPIDLLLPDVPVVLPDYIAAARVDPDKRGVRFGLRKGFQVSRLEAGEQLFIDLLPLNWQGLPPALPPAVVAELADRAKKAAILAEQKRKAEEAKVLNPTPTVRVGRNPTFFRVQFDWSVGTKAKFQMAEDKAVIIFDWPVPIDLYELKSDTPDQILGASNRVDANGSRVEIEVAEGIVPRFYRISDQRFVVDVDIDPETGVQQAIAAKEEAERQRQLALEAALKEAQSGAANAEPETAETGIAAAPSSIVPKVSTIGGTVRVVFPFERDTAAAVFRRGDVVWMLFETPVAIEAPQNGDALEAIASSFEVIPAGGTKVIRLDLSRERLATLGSEGRSWVLSLGDVLLNPTEPLTNHRYRDEDGHLRMTVDVQTPSQVHQFRDPVVGDMLTVVTAFPPARGVMRDLEYVDFSMLRSVHGLVLKPVNETLQVEIEGANALVTAPEGLTISALEDVRSLDSGNAPEFRGSYLELASMREEDPAALAERREALINRASQAEGRLRDVARLELAQFYLANNFAYEAIGVLDVLEKAMDSDDLVKKTKLARGIANTLAVRPDDALAILSTDIFSEEVDALMWRSMAKVDDADYVGARADAIAAEGVLDAYPTWIRSRFLLRAIRAAVETNDVPLATRYLEMVEFAKLDPEQVTEYHLFQGRVAEVENRIDEALDAYGQVIAADIRPTRAEAVYRTLLLLDQTGRIDLAKATQTLSAETMLWRGTPLEADMQTLLAQLYFRHKDYRLGFETVKQAVAYYPESGTITALLGEAQKVFSELYLDGRADELDPVAALSLYYDFRQLTPPGNRGDEMIRNLARRLVKVDLLDQAADLLEYQIDSRLKGVAQAQIAADLAVIRIANRDPEGALRVLSRTRLADLSPMLERQRRILEARALIDAGRQDLAIDLLSSLRGHDADLLRVEGYWKSRNYAAAAELIEVMYSPGLHAAPLMQTERMRVVQAAVGFALANDSLALSRVRAKFSEQIAQTPEWPMFDFVTKNVAPESIEFRKVAREVSGLDTLNAFLDTYRQMYAEGSDGVVLAAAAPTGGA